MADIVIAIAVEVAKVLVKPAIRQGQYLFCVNKVIRNLNNEKEELISKRDSILSVVEQAIRRTEIIEDAVNKWLNDVESLLGEVEKLEQDVKESLCFQGWCPTWRGYRLCREISKKTKTITAFKNRERFEPFSHPAPLLGIEYVSSENFTYFESTKVAYNQLLEALQDDNAYMIGLYGMGGSGKTTLATEVGKKAKSELKLFDQVISVTVSQTPNIERIQEKMEDMLGFKMEEKSKEGRAERLWLRLNAEKRVLIIVDDVWKKLNLNDIGICSNNNEKPNFKVLLTTRRRQVCVLMNCQKDIPLDLLSKTEGWSLFQKHADIGDGFSSNLLKVAQEISNECKGLPVAIKAVGSSLKRKGDDEWKVALERLKDPELFDDNEEEGFIDAFTCLKLSYDYLRNKKAEMLFLMCSMFPEDHEISIEDLIRYGVGLGLCRNFSSFDLRRSEIKASINKLVDSCLLLHSVWRKDHVKMHDVVRDVALRIASRSEDRKILLNLANNLNAFAISSWYKETNLNSYQLDAPRLEILLLQTQNENSLNISFASSDGVKELKVMSILSSYYSRSLLLFQSTQWLTNLQTLSLRGWNLGDLSFLISLTRLETLDLRSCCLKELPEGMEKLNKLKLLDLSGCEISDNFNYKSIGSCSQLEELYAFGYEQGCPSQCMEDFAALPNLRRFVIKLGWFRTTYYEECIRVLHLREFNISNLGAYEQNILQKAEDVCLECLHGGCKNVIPDMVGVVGGMNELTDLNFGRCSEIECLIDTTHGSFHVDALLPKLVNLVLLEMDNLKEMCRGPPLPVLGFFKKLEHLFIRKCQQLHSIVPEGVALDKHQQNHFTSNLRRLELQELPQLKFIWSCSTPRQVLSFQFLQLLKLDGCANLKSVFSIAIERSLPELTSLSIYRCDELEEIMAENEEPQNLSSTEVCFPKLSELIIKKCDKLKSLFSIAMVEMSPQLSTLRISEAAQLEVAFRHSSEYNIDNKDQIMLPSLENLQLKKLPSFVNVFQGFNFQAPKLQEISTHECPKFAPILRGTQVISLPHTEERHIFCLITTTWSELCGRRFCAALEAFLNLEVLRETKSKVQGIFHLQVEAETSNNSEWKPSKSNLRNLKLCNLPELRFIWNGFSKFMILENLSNVSLVECPKLKTIFSPDIVKCLPNLKWLSISNCEKLEEIISSDSENAQLKPSSSRPKQEVCFPGLYNIKVKRCNKLKCLFYDYETCHFPRVICLEIEECSQLEQAFGFKIEGGDRSFQREASEDGHLILFPKLWNLTVTDCPKYRLTSRESSTSCQHVTTQGQVFWLITASSSLQAFLNLGSLHLANSRAECIFQLQVEREISSNNEWTPLNSSLVGLRLHDLPELRFIWKDFSKFLSLEELTRVSLVDCPQLKTIFSPYIVRCLPNLKWLLISNCDKLEEIMSSDLENAQLRHPTACPQQEVCFPQLIKIEVKQCNKLKYLFYDSMACHFPKLESLEIEECSQIEKVFGSKGRADDESSQRWANEDGDRILLPKLRELVLKSLPIFFEIFRGFNLSQPMHKYLVTDCPIYNSTFDEASTSYQHTTTQGEHSNEES